MKSLALETIVVTIIAIVGMMSFLYLTGFFKNISNWFYCNVFVKIQSLFSAYQISAPEVCKDYIKEEVEVVRVDESDEKIVSRLILAHIIACWNIAEIKGLNRDHGCYEIHFNRFVDGVTEESVTKVLIEEDMCKSIENSDYGCGARDQILWKVENGIIRDQEIILIRYNSRENAIEVIG